MTQDEAITLVFKDLLQNTVADMEFICVSYGADCQTIQFRTPSITDALYQITNYFKEKHLLAHVKIAWSTDILNYFGGTNDFNLMYINTPKRG